MINRNDVCGNILVVVFNSKYVDAGSSFGTLRVKRGQSAFCAESEKADVARVECQILIHFVTWGVKDDLALTTASLLVEGAHAKRH